jgi:putative transposase
MGTKRSVLTDGRGVPLGLAVDGANRNDFKMARATIESTAAERPEATPEAPQGLCLDTGYDYDEVRALLDEFGSRTSGLRIMFWVLSRSL